MSRARSLRWARDIGIAATALALATIAVAILQDVLGVSNPSAVYLVAVVSTAILSGTGGAIAASIGSLPPVQLPLHRAAVHAHGSDPGEWVSVCPAALHRASSSASWRRCSGRRPRSPGRGSARPAPCSSSAAPWRRARPRRRSCPRSRPILAAETRDGPRLDRPGPDDAGERVVADTGPAKSVRSSASSTCCAERPVMRRRSGCGSTRRAGPGSAAPSRQGSSPDRRRIASGSPPSDRTLGSIWALAAGAPRPPDRTETRLLSAAADQVGLALAHDRLAAEAQAAEIARAERRAEVGPAPVRVARPADAAGGDPRRRRHAPSGQRPQRRGRAESAAAIDREVEYLNRLVTNLLDLSRIEAGALRAERDVFELDDLLGPIIDRLRPRLGRAAGRGGPARASRSSSTRSSSTRR